MKTIINLKNKANAMSKEKLEQFKASRAQEDATIGSGASANSSRTPSPTRAAAVARTSSPPKPDRCPVIESMVQNERRETVKEEFYNQSPESYTRTRHLNIKAATYNVNGRRPPTSLDLSPWLDLSGHPADVIALGFQEIVPLNAQNIMLGANLDAASEWEKLIDICLNGDREEGHFVMNPASTPDSMTMTPSPTKKPMDSHRLTRLHSAEQPLSQSGNADACEVKTPRSTDTGTVMSDELEGYMSPADDTGSILSDDHFTQRSYVQVIGKQMVGVYLSVWVKYSLLKHIRGVQTTTVATGMMGYLGNKGAVAARMRIFDSGICFVSSHLSSGEQEGDEVKRNSDYAEIVRRATFPADGSSMDADALTQRTNGGESSQGGISDRAFGQWGSWKGVLDNSHAIWMGDLNYRLNAPDPKARALVKAADWTELVKSDQLTLARRDSQAFQGWEEGPMIFPPTYKFKRGTSQYVGAKDPNEDDVPTSSGVERGQKQEAEKTRTPAWTDRILWRSQGGLRQTFYNSANLFVSDHKPVVANFSLVAKEYDRSKIQTMLETAKSVIQEREDAAIPRCELDPTRIEAGVVSYAESKIVHTVLRNRSQVRAQWEIAPLTGQAHENIPDEEIRLSPRWVHIQPVKGQLEPGESVEIRMTLWVDGGRECSADYLVSLLKGKLDAAIILKVEDGNHIFCNIVGHLSPSFFGLSLTTLSTRKRPISPAEGWNSGSPSLKINVQKKQRERQPSDGPPLEFFSPSAVISEPAFDDVIDEDGNKIKSSKRNSLDRLESASVHAHAESRSSSLPLAENSADSTGLSTVDQMFAAFGVKLPEKSGDQLAQDETANESKPENVPPEVRAMTDYILDSKVASASEVFVACLGAVYWWQPRTPANCSANVERRWHQPAVQQIRLSLDQGKGIPKHVGPQDVAATLLSFFLALPHPFLPKDTAHDGKFVNSQSVLEHLKRSTSPAEYATIVHVADFFCQLIQEESPSDRAAAKATLVNLLAEIWTFQSIEGFRRSSSGGTKPDGISAEFSDAVSIVSTLLT